MLFVIFLGVLANIAILIKAMTDQVKRKLMIRKYVQMQKQVWQHKQRERKRSHELRRKRFLERSKKLRNPAFDSEDDVIRSVRLPVLLDLTRADISASCQLIEPDETIVVNKQKKTASLIADIEIMAAKVHETPFHDQHRNKLINTNE